jgi:hypothetical protein
MTAQRPNFLAIGAKKAGSTWLYAQLRQHPDLWLPPVKELHYFYGRRRLDQWRVKVYERYLRGQEIDPPFLHAYFMASTVDMDWYQSLFAFGADRLTGDVDPNLFDVAPETVRHINASLPAIRIILILRNPVMRSWSHFKMTAEQRGVNVIDFALNAGAPLLVQGPIPHRSSYSTLLPSWLANTAPDRLLMLPFDRLVLMPDELLRQVWDFLGVRRIPTPATAGTALKMTQPVPMPDAVGRRLHERHAPDQAAALAALSASMKDLLL